MEEIFKEVKNYEGIYKISNLGRVKSLGNNYSKKEKILKGCINSSGYIIVTLCKDGNKNTKSVHQMVAESFFNHTSNGYKLVVNHIDFDKNNNKVNNLEIISQRDNSNKKHLKSSSKYTGVWIVKDKWRSQIGINGKQKHLGYFRTELEAHNAYQNALKQIN